MYNDPNWFFTDEPTVMWGRQLEYRQMGDGSNLVITPDDRRFTTLRRAFALYRVGVGERGPAYEQLEVMRRTLAWLHCGRYEQPVVEEGAKCPSAARGSKVNDLRVICDVFGGSRALFEHYLLHLEILKFATVIADGTYGLTREGQSALIMLELTRPNSKARTWVGWLELLHCRGEWISVDPNRWAHGMIALRADDLNSDN